jgi:hypothetical protein
MNSKKLFLWPAILVAAALIVAAALLFLVETTPDNVTPASGEAQSMQSPRSLAPTGGFADSDFGFDRSFSRSLPTGRTALIEGEEPMAAWEKPISDLLDSDDENEEVAVKLAALGPTLPLEGYVECIQHVVNLLDDEQYKLASDMLMNSSLHPEVREVIYSDVLDRPNEVKVPVLLGLLGSYGHPLQAEAREQLQRALGVDLGPDPAAWQGAVAAFLARSAAEEAAAEAAFDDYDGLRRKGEN